MAEQLKVMSVDEALASIRMPVENVPWVRAITQYLGVTECVRTSGYVKARRSEGAPDLHIAYGWTSGFRNPDEIRAALGDLAPENPSVWKSGRSKDGIWGVTHPINRGYDAGSRAGQKPVRDRPVCMECFTQLPETGVCSNCEE